MTLTLFSEGKETLGLKESVSLMALTTDIKQDGLTSNEMELVCNMNNSQNRGVRIRQLAKIKFPEFTIAKSQLTKF